MGLSTAERNRRKRERKKKQRAEQLKQEEAAQKADTKQEDAAEDVDVEIEYVTETTLSGKPAATNDGLPPKEEDLNDLEAVFKRYQERANISSVITDDENDAKRAAKADGDSDEDDDDDEDDANRVSKRKWREMTRPSVSELKRRVQRPDLVDAHDITADNPDFLIELKSVDGTVPVPRHWGRKRKYLQGKRGYEKAPFQLPDFILKTGIAQIRDTLADDEADQSAKQKNRSRMAPKMGAMDVDYGVLHEAFFKHQTKPANLTGFGDLYYEGKELETSKDILPGGVLSKDLREALGMINETSPPPYLMNMQRYGPPPSYGTLKIPGLNAPLPSDKCQYGFHPGGWGKPPTDAYGNPTYGGNPFDPPGSKTSEQEKGSLVTSSGSTLLRDYWGGMPLGDNDDGDDDDEESESESESESDSDDGMDESVNTEGSEEEEEAPTVAAAINLRKDVGGDETPAKPQKQLYTVLSERNPTADGPDTAVFKSSVEYVLPGQEEKGDGAAAAAGAESVLVKATEGKKKKKSKKDSDEYGDLGKDFKF